MTTALAYRDEFLDHETGHHPENYKRLTSILDKLKSKSYFKDLLQPEIREATEEEISTIHTLSYIKDFQKRVKSGGGYFDGDTPYSPGSYKSAALAVGSGIVLADTILDGKANNGIALVRPPGHHAEKHHAMGFCMFNNVAVTAKYLQSRGVGKVLILDWDVHHGNGTEHSFYEDDSVYFISTHQYPFYPGTGAEKDKGSGKGLGYNLNIPLARGASNQDYLNVFQEKVIPAIDKFLPEFILISAGFDAHRDDPLGGMDLSTSAFERFTEIISLKAKEICKGRVISFLEGGYDLFALADSVEAHIAVLRVKMNKKMLITGASRGIGKAIALHFAKKGYELILVSRSEDDLKSVTLECKRLGAKTYYVLADLSNVSKVKEVIDDIQKTFPNISNLILNAGISTSLTFEDNSLENIQNELNINYLAPVTIIKEYIPALKTIGGGNIICISSFSALVPFPGNSSYAASKSALYSLCTSLKIELEPYNIHVGCVLPGSTKTDMTKQFHDAPFVPFDDPSEIAQCVEDSIQKKEAVVIPGILYNAAALTYKLFPKPVDFLMTLAAKIVLPSLKK